MHGLYRLDGPHSAWTSVGNLPDVLPAQNGQSQGDYDIALAVDPVDFDLVYLGGSYVNVDPYPGSIWRCALHGDGGGYTVQSNAWIGTSAHETFIR